MQLQGLKAARWTAHKKQREQTKGRQGYNPHQHASRYTLSSKVVPLTASITLPKSDINWRPSFQTPADIGDTVIPITWNYWRQGSCRKQRCQHVHLWLKAPERKAIKSCNVAITDQWFVPADARVHALALWREEGGLSSFRKKKALETCRCPSASVLSWGGLLDWHGLLRRWNDFGCRGLVCAL